jgi:predicted pyridoxine 5'-phosphate oxidase superfamily flavin-nucleotide-binding protein
MGTPTARESAFHVGERSVQERAGEVQQAARVAGVIHGSIPAAAFSFLRERAFIVIAAADDKGAVWCTQLGSQPGFMYAVDEYSLRVEALPLPDDPLFPVLQNACAVGTIAIDFATHRRIRLNGTSHPTATGIVITTAQVYANCPKYIAARSIEFREESTSERSVLTSTGLGEEARAIVGEADTFFIGSAFAEGADASHRGGPTGFVEIVDDGRLRWPDYAGNSMFMTLGNIAESPAAGLLFIDWRTGTTVQLTGRARIDWNRAAAKRFAGAQRVVEFTIDQSIVTRHASPLRWSAGIPSRFNPAVNPREHDPGDRRPHVALEATPE